MSEELANWKWSRQGGIEVEVIDCRAAPGEDILTASPWSCIAGELHCIDGAQAEPAPELPPITAIAKLTLQPGDSLVVFVEGRLTVDGAGIVRRHVQQQLDTEVPVLVMDGSMGIGVLSTPAVEAAEPASGARALHGALVEASGDVRLGGRGA